MSDEANSAVVSSLTELRAALEAKLEARRVDGHSEFETIYLHSLLTDDTVAALLDVARAAREHIAAWDATEEAIYERDETLHETQHGLVLSEQYWAELVDAVRKANVAEHRTADALRAALYALVGEDALECEAPPQPQQRR